MKRPNTVVIALLVVLSCSLTSCGKADKQQGKEAAGTNGAHSEGKAMMRFKSVSCVDRGGIGIEAFRILIPADWSFAGGITWKLDNPGMPAVAGFRIHDPSGTDEVEVFPNQGFFWTTNPMVLQTFPVGSRYFGNEVRRPVGPLEALRSIVLPRFRKGVKNLKIVTVRDLPQLAQELGAGAQSQPGVTATASGASVRIEYQRNGNWMEEDVYGVVESYSFPMQSMFGTVTNTMWTVSYLFSCKARKGELDSKSKLFQTVLGSFTLNPQWFSKYNQVVEYLIQRQIQHIRSIGELSRIISRTNNEISDMMMRSYNDRQSVYDRVAENFSQHIRGVDEYYNPVEGRPVELPSGYNHAWVNGLGEYVVSDDPNYNPNIGSNLHWQEMKRK